MSEALGNQVDRTFVSEATRRDARGQKDRGSLEAEIAGMDAQIQRDGDRMRDHQARLAEINGAIAGRRLPNARYDAFCQEQATLKREIIEITNRRLAMKDRRERLKADLPKAPSLKPSLEAMIRALTTEIRGLRRDFQQVAKAMGVVTADEND